MSFLCDNVPKPAIPVNLDVTAVTMEEWPLIGAVEIEAEAEVVLKVVIGAIEDVNPLTFILIPLTFVLIPLTFVLLPVEDVTVVPDCCAVGGGGGSRDNGREAGLVEERSVEISSNRSKIPCT